jgi:serine/threonine-protein kinase
MADIPTRLSTAIADRYRIERELGQGGMATVYLAEDLKHDRKVALKVLRPELAAVLGAERFVVEIKTTAALQHPHILPLFDSGSADGFLYYVMPYIEGETLRNRLNRDKQMGIEESLRICSEVADALDYAHRHGVIHRDIKPENILLHDSRPMVADFGIALAVSAAAGGRMTETGLSLGTPHYMSPEQATADRDITARSDVYSLASVLYEMLAGQPPHMGGTAQQIIMKIIAEPAALVTTLRKSVPTNVAAALAQALEKLPADRFESAKAFSEALTNRGFQTATAVSAGGGFAATGRASWRTVLRHPITLVMGVALLAAGVAWWRAAGRVDVHTTVRFAIPFGANDRPTPGDVTGTPFALSPDGKLFAYAGAAPTGVRQLFLRPLNDITARLVPGTAGAGQLFFSPDGRWVGFYGSGQLHKVPVEGGTPSALAQASTVSGASWSPSGKIVLSSQARISYVPEAGGPLHVVGSLDSASGEVLQVWPVVMPDGINVLYSSWAAAGRDAAKIAIINIETGKIRVLDLLGTAPLLVTDGFLVYATSAGTIMAVSFDQKGGRVLGQPVPVLDGVLMGGAGVFKGAVSQSGSLLYTSGTEFGPLVLAEPRGATRVLVPETRGSSYPRYSPDGKHLAISITDTKTTDIWILDLPSGPLRRLTQDGAVNDRPEWTPDSRRVLFRTNRGGQYEIWSQAADGNTRAERYFGLKDAGVYEGSISSDGAYFIFQRDSTGGSGRVWYRRLKGDTASGVIASGAQGQQTAARFSPDARWVVYESDELGTREIYIKPFPALTERHQISLLGGSQPVWSRDGRRVFYLVGQRLLSATLSFAPSVTVVARDTIFDNRLVSGFGYHANYDVAPDGKHFVFISTSESNETAPVILAHDWKYEMLARMRGASAH